MHEGMTLEELGALVRLREADRRVVFWYDAPSAPEPDPAYRSYSYVVTPTRGVCEVIATGPEFATDRAGVRARERLAALERSLSERYGKPAARVDVHPRAPDGGDWTKLQLDGVGQVGVAWFPKPGAGKHDAIREVNVHVKVVDLDTALLRLTYRFDNSPACLEQARAELNRRGPTR